jgi:hypothetical protein
MDQRDPLQPLAGRCSQEAWYFLEALRGHSQFNDVIDTLRTKEGKLTEQTVAEALLDAGYTGLDPNR